MSLWLSFWADQGLTASEVGFGKGMADHGDQQRLEALLDQPKLRTVGIVVNALDSIMHGATLGMAGMHNQVRQWAAQGHFAEMLRRLTDEGFEVIITSDHGNVEAWGIGSPSDKSLADVRGERVRVFPNDTLRGVVQKTFPTAIAWDPVGLPPGFSPLFSSGRDAFIVSGKRTVAHGGIALEELIVPFVRVQRKGVG